MKYDLTKKQTIGATRTLYSLQQAMLSSLCENSFEEISVGELCKKAMLPRATFYNYFYDKYDLLQYCLINIHKQLDNVQNRDGTCRERMNTLMENCFDYLDNNIYTLQNILKHNKPNQYLITQLRFYILSSMIEIFKNNSDSHSFLVPQEIAANLYSQVILIILEWRYLSKRECSKAQAKQYLQQMVSGIDIL